MDIQDVYHILDPMSDYSGYAFKCRLCGMEFTTREEADSHYKDVRMNEPESRRK